MNTLHMFALTGLIAAVGFLAGNAPVNAQVTMKPVCGPTHFPYVQCLSEVAVNAKGTPIVSPTPQGFSPTQLLEAYKLSGTASGTMPIIGIADAYGDPNIVNDLKTYSKTFNLPSLPTCKGAIKNSATPCFQAVNETGGSNLYSRDDWNQEISLDVEIAHAICQNCGIVLVEASTTSITDAGTAVNTAVSLGATQVSNSYGFPDSWCTGNTCTGYDKSYYDHPGVAVVAGSGDDGYPNLYYPGSSSVVTSVGGTDLNFQGGKYVSETAWSDGGSGCSTLEPKPSWQTDPDCAKRMAVDVSAVASPGAAIYDSVGGGGWYSIGGTSLSSPIVAAVYALAGPIQNNLLGSQTLYDNMSNPHLTNVPYLHDITSGSNGTCKKGSYFCNAGTGYDGPTGLGSPLGIRAF